MQLVYSFEADANDAGIALLLSRLGIFHGGATTYYALRWLAVVDLGQIAW